MTQGWPYLQHRCRRARLVNFYKFHHHHGSIATDTKWIPGDYPSITRAHHSHSLLYPVPTCQVLYWLQEVLPFPQRNQGLKWPHWGCGCCTYPWDFLFTSSKISTFGVGHAPQVSSVDDGYGCASQGLPPASSWIDLVGDVKYQWDTQNSMLFHACL